MKCKLLLGAAIVMLFSSHAHAQSAEELQAAEAYMNTFEDISLEDALLIMGGDRKNEIDEVFACVRDIRGYAGLEIRHVPKYRVIAKFNKQPAKKMRQCTQNKDLFTAVGAGRSLEELELVKQSADTKLEQSGIGFESDISLKRNRVTVSVNQDDLKTARKLFRRNGFLKRSIRFEGVSSLGIETVASRRANNGLIGTKVFRSGIGGVSCTSGFSVKNNLGQRGATTANHCGRQISYGQFSSPQTGLGPDENQCSEGTTSVRGIQEQTDLQWYTKSNDTYLPEIDDFNDIPGFITRNVKGVLRSGSAQPAGLIGGFFPTPGTVVCMSGQTFGSTVAGTSARTQPLPEVIKNPGQPNQCTLRAKSTRAAIPTFSGNSQETCGVFTSYDASSFIAKAVIPGSSIVNEFTQGGDSGGPVYTFGFNSQNEYGVLAMGSVRGHTSRGGELAYSPIESFDALGIRVISSEDP